MLIPPSWSSTIPLEGLELICAYSHMFAPAIGKKDEVKFEEESYVLNSIVEWSLASFYEFILGDDDGGTGVCENCPIIGWYRSMDEHGLWTILIFQLSLVLRALNQLSLSLSLQINLTGLSDFDMIK